MSTTIDQRVVEMQFDNKQFERNVETSLSSIDKLKKSLNLEGASKGLENVNAAARNVDMSGISSAVETVQSKFSALGIVGVTTLVNLTNSAVNYGKRIVSALTIDPIKTGFSEYETKINAIQTIMSNTASKGTTMEDVTKVIGELNTYADKTIYNFAEMTRNIGTFTAAGVGLEESAAAIQGIANLAAASGSTSQQASTAMYQLSQALSSGTVKLMDWNSVVNAGMGGEKFQEALKATAKDHGVAIDDIIKKQGSFRESLSTGWLSADILNETLRKFTVEGAKEYAESMLKSGKYTQEQADALIKEAQAMEDAATKVKTFTQLWDTLKESAQSGWSQTWEIVVGNFEEAKDFLTNVSDVIGGMIGASADARNKLLEGALTDLGGRKLLIDSAWNVFNGILSVVEPIKEAFREIFPPTTAEQLHSIIKTIHDFTAKLKLSEKASNNLKRTFKGLFAIVNIVKQVFVSLFKIVSPLFGTVDDLGGGILGLTAKFGDWLVSLNESISKSNTFSNAVNTVKNVVAKVSEFLAKAVSAIMDFGGALTNTANTASDTAEKRLSPLAALGKLLSSIFSAIGKLLKPILTFATKAASGIGKAIGGMLDGISSAIQNANYDAVFDILSGGIMTALGVFIAKFVKAGGDILDNTAGFIENIQNIFEGVGDALGAFTQSLKADALKKIATAIAILAAALLVLSLIDSEKLTFALGAITVLFTELLASLSIFGKIGDSKEFNGVTKISALLISISSALLILSIAMKIMSTMSWSEMGVALVSVVVGLGAMVAAMNLLPEANVKKASKAIKQIAAALLVLAIAIKIMSTMSWSEMGVGLITMVVGLGAMVAAVNLLPKDTALRAAGMISLAASMLILSVALKIMSTMSFTEILQGITALAGSLAILAVAMNVMKKAIPGALAMMIVAPALVVLAGAFKIMASMSWESVAKGLVALGGSLLIIAVAMIAMKNALPGAAAMLVFAASLAVLTPMLMLLGSMSIQQIGKSLLMLAGVFAVVGVAGLLLQPIIPTILALSGALALLGVACVAIGSGVLMIGAGLTALAAAIAASGLSIVTFVSSIISLVPYLIEQIGVGIIRLCEVIAGSADAICKAATVIIIALVDALVASVPKLVEGVLIILDELLKSLVVFTPKIVEALFDLLISVINSLATKTPQLIKALANLIASIFEGVIDVLRSIDPKTLMDGILAIGMVTALLAALSFIPSLVPGAMLGVLGLGAVVTELAIVLAAIGTLSKIPGFEEMVEGGGRLMKAVGTAIGGFIGGILAGFAEGALSTLPEIGTHLSDFMTNIQPFVQGAKEIDSSTFKGVQSLVDIILALTAANIVEGLTSWFTGGSSLVKFGEDLAEFAPNMKEYADTVKGIDPSAVKASAAAAKSLVEMTKAIPNEGGMVAWFTGENSISKFGTDIISLGKGIKGFSDSVSGVNPDAIVSASTAAKSIAEMTKTIPNEGGMVAWFTGENSISKFGNDIKNLGSGLKAFSDSIVGINPNAIIAVVNAAKALADMTNNIPNEGGMAAWFAGENSISKFGKDIINLGQGLKGFSDQIVGVNPAVIIAAVNAAKALAEMTQTIPNEGGMAAWFAGENSISKFGTDIINLGKGLKGFSDQISGISPEKVTAAANSAKSIAEMTKTIPNEGGMVAWFTGENSLSKFSIDIARLGSGLKGFSDNVIGINPEKVTAAANAAKALADMSNAIPNSEGMVAWFTGDNSLSKFAFDITNLGAGIRGFSDKVIGINPEKVTAAASAAKSLAEMTTFIPNSEGMVAWFTGERSLSKFSADLTNLGIGIAGFSLKVAGVNPEEVTAAANAAKALAEMTTFIPKSEGMVAWFTGERSLSKFSADLTNLGKGIGSFSKEVTGINPESVSAAAKAAKHIAEMADTIPNEGGLKAWFVGDNSVSKFAEHFPALGKGLKAFSDSVKGISPENIEAAANAAKKLAQMAKAIPDDTDKIDDFAGHLEELGEELSDFFTECRNITADRINSVSNAVDILTELNKLDLSAAEDEIEDITKALTDLASLDTSEMMGALDNAVACGEAIVRSIKIGVTNSSSKDTMTAAIDSLTNMMFSHIDKTIGTRASNSGKQVAVGIAQGITANLPRIRSAAVSAARAALNAAEDELDINSPSKEFYRIGSYGGQGLVNALLDYAGKVYNAGSTVATYAKNGFNDAIGRLSDIINNNIDSQPTIRPVLDLSNVQSGISTIGSLLGMNPSVGVLANVNSVNSMMNRRSISGTDDVVSAINKLSKELGNVGNTSYNINGITYDDGSNIADAITAIVQAARMERRV